MNDYSNPMVTYDEIVDALKAILDSSKSNGYLDEFSFLNAKYDTIKKNPLQVEKEEALIKAIQTLEKALGEVSKRVRENLEENLEQIIKTNVLTIPISYPHTYELRKLAAQEEFVNKLGEMSLPLEMLLKVEDVDSSVKKIEEIEDFANIFEEIESSGIAAEPAASVEAEVALEEEPAPIAEEEPKDDFDVSSLGFASEKERAKAKVSDVDFNELPDVEEQEEPVKETVKEAEEKEVTPEPIPEEIKEETKEKIDTSKIKLIKKAIDKAKEKNNLQLVKILEQQLLKEVESLKK